MQVFCWNVASLPPTLANIQLAHKAKRGLDSVSSKDALRDWFEDEVKADIVCLQEVKISAANLPKHCVCVAGNSDEWQSFWATSRKPLGYSGVTTWASRAWAPVDAACDCLGGGDDDIDQQGRVVVTDHGSFVLINVYVPRGPDASKRQTEEWGETSEKSLAFKAKFLTALRLKMNEYTAQGRLVMAVGDFNVAVDPADSFWSLDGSFCSEELDCMRALLDDFVDVWRRLHPDAQSVYSFWDEKTSGRVSNKGSRIDYALVSPQLAEHVVSCEILQRKQWSKWSDHAPLLLQMGAALAPPLPHPPCAAWLQLKHRFFDPAQRSIAHFFAPTRKKQKRAGDGATASGGAGEGGASGCEAAAQATPSVEGAPADGADAPAGPA